MKKFIFLLSLLVACFTFAVAQVVDPAPVVDNTQTFMVMCTFAGIIVRSFIVTIQGVKNPDNNSPTVFDIKYWINDNSISKVYSVVASILFIIGFVPFLKGVVSVVIACILSFVAGYFIDKIGDWLLGLAKKQAVKAATPDITSK